MADGEFRETGRTQNQRLRDQETTRPRKPSGAQSFVHDFLAKNPSANELAQKALGTPPPGPRLGEDLSLGELMDVARMILPNPHTLAAGQARDITGLFQRLNGGQDG